MDKFELLEKLRCLDEISLLELLEINSDDLVDAFLDKIEDNLTGLYEKTRDTDPGRDSDPEF
jgi:hypothetical protein